MYPRILHIYGPLWINSYGVMIALGFLSFLYLAHKDRRRKKILSTKKFFDTLFIGLIAGIVGGRLLYVVENLEEFAGWSFVEIFYLWQGGFSILGTIVATLVTISIYLRLKKVAILPFLDLCATYAPLMQSISRLGCFLAGCCFGKVAPALYWAVKYTNPYCLAPLKVNLHPTQLYSSMASLLIFFVMLALLKVKTKPGQTIFFYLLLESSSRFIVDFWRGDSEPLLGILSFPQLISCILFVVALSGLALVGFRSKRR